MKIFKSKMERLLDDFPWLWAVCPSWSKFKQVQVVQLAAIDPFLLLHEHNVDPNHALWVKATRGGAFDDRLGEVRRVTYTPGKSIAEMIFDTFGLPYRFQYLVTHYEREGVDTSLEPYLIYRGELDYFVRETPSRVHPASI